MKLAKCFNEGTRRDNSVDCVLQCGDLQGRFGQTECPKDKENKKATTKKADISMQQA